MFDEGFKSRDNYAGPIMVRVGMPVITDISGTLRAAFEGLPYVKAVLVDNDEVRNAYDVEIVISRFDRGVTAPIYAAQRDLKRQFDQFTFDFHIVDASPQAPLLDATHAERLS